MRESILQASLPLFVEKGFIYTEMQDIAEAAGISVQELKTCFARTDDVFMELIRSMDHQKFDSMGEYEQQSGSSWEKIVKFLKLAEHQMEIVNENSLLPAVFEFNLVSWRTGRNLDFIQSRYDLGTNEIYQFFKKGVDSGEFEPQLPLETIVGFVGSQVNGLILAVQLIGKEKIDFKGQMEALLVALENMLKPHKR